MRTMTAGGAIIRSRFVKMDSTSNRVVVAGANDLVIGISQIGAKEAPIPSVTQDPPYAASAAGDVVNVHAINSGENKTIRVELGTGGCTVGQELESAANGLAIVAAGSGTHNIAAIALETGSVGELVEVLLVRYPKVIA